MYERFCQAYCSNDFEPTLKVYAEGADPALREEVDLSLDYIAAFIEIFT